MKLTELNLKPEVLKGLEDMGYTELTPVQEQTFPHILAGRDLLARAETGSGKTGACGVPLVQATDASLQAVQGLILVPTRELALQYVQEIADIARHTEVAPFAVYGGFEMRIQRAKLDHGVHILVATPGRLIDLLYNSPLSLSEVRTFVLDEADEMLKMGFVDDVEFVISCLVHEHQTLLFSATMPAEIKKLSSKYLKDPVTVELNVKQVAPQNLEHCFQKINSSHHFESFMEYLQQHDPVQAIVFCNSRDNANKLFRRLSREVESVELIHGGLDQSRRTSLFNRFRRKEIKIMVATDVAGRGLDFSHVSHVINYDFPRDRDTYTHRSGRTARLGRKGTAMTFYDHRNLGVLSEIIKVNRIKPVWHGREPDLKKAAHRRASTGRSHKNGGGRFRRR